LIKVIDTDSVCQEQGVLIPCQSDYCNHVRDSTSTKIRLSSTRPWMGLFPWIGHRQAFGGPFGKPVCAVPSVPVGSVSGIREARLRKPKTLRMANAWVQASWAACERHGD